MDLLFSLGVAGGIILVLGAMYPVKKIKNPRHSAKNWLFAVGGCILFLYAVLGYLYGNGTLFFAILEILAIVSSGLMLSDISEKTSKNIIGVIGIILVLWSLFLMKDYSVAIFIIGLILISLGYVSASGTAKRNIFLALGSILIALFSYLGNAWVFFWLNIFFAGFSFHHYLRLIKK